VCGGKNGLANELNSTANEKLESRVVDPIYVNANKRASLRFPDFSAKFKTVEDAVHHWRKLQPGDREHVVLVLEGGQVYQPSEIGLLRFRS
jgi:hypothetical protein